MHNAFFQELHLCTICMIVVISLGGCGVSEIGDLQSSNQEEIEVPLSFSVSAYKELMIEDRSPITECRDLYNSEISELKESNYQNLHFENCEFSEFPEMDQLKLLVGTYPDITPEESWDVIENWVESIGKADEVDLKKEIRTVSAEVTSVEELDINYEWPLFYDHMDEMKSGAGAYISTDNFHLQILGEGIYSLSDGKISRYLGITEDGPSQEALGEYQADIVESGTLKELKDKKYPLISGELTIGEGANLVQDYFMAGTPFSPQEGVTIDVVSVNVYRLSDVYGYDYMLRRKYESVPFALGFLGSFQNYDGRFVEGDRKNVYVVDDIGVSGFNGTNEGEHLIPLVTDDRMLDLKEAVDWASEHMASMINIHADTVGLVYVPVTDSMADDPTERIIHPCWEFIGTNQVKGEHISLYVDVFTGDIFYYTR